MHRRLVLLFDGTWNQAEDQTSVARFAGLLARLAADGGEQIPLYDKGVGTHLLDRVSGGFFGYGLTDNIREAYRGLAERFRPGDRIFLLGFSRGAYTARSLAGLIRKCGILRQPDEQRVRQAYDLYRDKTTHPDADAARAFRQRHSHETRIRFIGVWDTVGNLGIPLSGVPFGRDYFQWHDTALSGIVDYACQALAIDEHRRDFAPALWNARKPENLDVEQRWFIGAHANVGGGYRHDRLPNLPLAWMQRKAAAAGLAFTTTVPVSPEDSLAPIRDSYREFLHGLYRWWWRGERHHRRFGTGVNETIDPSVWQRWEQRADYRPPTVADHQP